MTRFAVILALCLLTAPPAWPGAWPRGKGELFLSVASWVSADADGRVAGLQSLYAEYGLTEGLTLGLDAHAQGNGGQRSAVAFLRWPVRAGAGRDRFALSAGLGWRQDAPLLRLGAGWGRGWEHGWLALDAHADFLRPRRVPTVKLEATWGRRRRSGDLVLFRVTAERPAGSATALWLAPGYVWKAPSGMQVELGLSGEALRGRQGRLKLGLWRRF